MVVNKKSAATAIVWLRKREKMTNTVEYYIRDIDAHCGTQRVRVENGIIKSQILMSKGNGSYTGDGNPELVGQPKAALRGKGFTKTRSHDE